MEEDAYAQGISGSEDAVFSEGVKVASEMGVIATGVSGVYWKRLTCRDTSHHLPSYISLIFSFQIHEIHAVLSSCPPLAPITIINLVMLA